MNDIKYLATYVTYDEMGHYTRHYEWLKGYSEIREFLRVAEGEYCNIEITKVKVLKKESYEYMSDYYGSKFEC